MYRTQYLGVYIEIGETDQHKPKITIQLDLPELLNFWVGNGERSLKLE